MQSSPDDVWMWASNYAINSFSSLISDSWVSMWQFYFLCPSPHPCSHLYPGPFSPYFLFPLLSRLEHLRDNWLFWNPSPAYYNILPLNSRCFLSVRGLLLQVIITWLWVTYAMDPAYREGTFLSCDGSSKRFLWFINVLLSSPFYVTFSCFFFFFEIIFLLYALTVFIFSRLYSLYFCKIYKTILGARVG